MSTNLRQVCLLGQDSPTNEPARRPAHQEKLTVLGGALECAQGNSYNSSHVPSRDTMKDNNLVARSALTRVRQGYRGGSR